MTASPEFALKNPLMVALDVDSIEDCLRIATALGGRVGAFKVGPRLTMRYGADLVAKLSRHAPVFVDNKYLDIPNTMESAIRATFEAGATIATIHAWSGGEAMKRLAQVEAELNQKRPFKILGVTILTSFSQESLPPAVHNIPNPKQVEDLASLANGSGITGLVCSVKEVRALRAKSKSAFLVTPGIRMPGDAAGDQKRIETPEVALGEGSSALVVGRPIVEAKDPVEAAEKFLHAIRDAR
jgi:orotidine-5'-phosphate decarboxylase